MLEARGVSKQQSQALAEEFSAQETTWQGRGYPTLEFYCQYFDWMCKRKDCKKPTSGAWLAKAGLHPDVPR